MISLVFASQISEEKRLEKKSWYSEILHIVSFVIPAWIEMDTSIIFLNESEMRKVNRIYHRQNRVTDILSFFYPKSETQKNEGELYLCIPQILRQATRYHTTFLDEYMRILIHGFLHLQGYDHMNATERKRMNMYAAEVFLRAKKKRVC
ncbi:rRNA maturation RNase YbeY [Candidatus Uhrbacteria bacterium]|nr:rRNA maturation RNase YbeY [Candidatus Uhrbacteria bacterium]